MAYSVEQLLEHEHLGLGKVLHVEGDRVRIHFKKDRSARTMSAKHSPLKLSSVEHDPYFDGIKAAAPSRAKPPSPRSKSAVAKPKAPAKYPTQQEAVSGFLKVFPEGFNDPAYLGEGPTGERSYKVKAHELWKETLNKAEFEQLIAAGNFEETVQRAKRVEAGVNLLHPQFERAPLWGAVRDPQAAEDFSRGLFNLIYGEDPFELKFNQFATTLDQLPQPKSSTLKWPAMTIFPFLALPTEHLFMKVEVTKKAAQRLDVSLNYKSTPNWLTYSCLLQLGQRLMIDLKDLGPRDMIDVQSFIFVTGQANYPGS
ncbi:MAG: hypothetical protein JNL18_18090 [Planctomycetaceae bacterium]|nr:hypothetical protein [Planctomycetaceae bacterium]